MSPLIERMQRELVARGNRFDECRPILLRHRILGLGTQQIAQRLRRLPVAGTTRASMNERSGQMRQTTTAEVRLNDGKATSSGAARPSCSPFWLPRVGHDRISLRRCANETENDAQQPGNLGNVEFKTFAAEFDPQPFHLDEEAARDTIFRGLAASGLHTAALTMRLVVESELKPAGGIVGASVDQLRWPLPVRPGDELRVESETLEVRPLKSRPDQGLIKVRTTTLNQNGPGRTSFRRQSDRAAPQPDDFRQPPRVRAGNRRPPITNGADHGDRTLCAALALHLLLGGAWFCYIRLSPRALCASSGFISRICSSL